MNLTTVGISAATSLPTLAAVAVGNADPSTLNFFQQHTGIAIAIMTASSGIIAFFLHRTLKQNDEQHTTMIDRADKDREAFREETRELWKANDKKMEAFTTIKVQHDLMFKHCRKGEPADHNHGRQDDDG